jgi:hypothetical protein
MLTLKINSKDFDFERFMDTMVDFIERNFGTDGPDAAGTLRYFHSFFQPSDSKNSNFPEKDPWSITDFKNIILKGDESIFLPFSSGLQLDHSINLANGETIHQSRSDSPNIGLVDCWGFLVSLTNGKFSFKSAIAWGDVFHSIEEASNPKMDRMMKKFLKSFMS